MVQRLSKAPLETPASRITVPVFQVPAALLVAALVKVHSGRQQLMASVF